MKPRLIIKLLTLAMAFTQALQADDKPTSPAQPPSNLPTLFIIGDSTVKNGSGTGAGGLWGWGDPIGEFFDKTKINVKNKALGGRSSRTYQTEGLWDKVLAEMKPGDFVLMQFGHNDGGSLNTGTRPRASLKGVGPESQEVVMEGTGKKEVVHTYGWYMRKYITDAKAKGATPIVLSPVPRNMWKDGKVVRSTDYGKWAADAAKAGDAAFVDLNGIIADKYDPLGPEKVLAEYFTAADHTHTSVAGAKLNAACVIEGLQGLQDCALCQFIIKKS